MADCTDHADAIAKLQDGYKLRVRTLTGGLLFAFLQSPAGSTNKTYVVPQALARQLLDDGIVKHARTTKYGAEVYEYANL